MIIQGTAVGAPSPARRGVGDRRCPTGPLRGRASMLETHARVMSFLAVPARAKLVVLIGLTVSLGGCLLEPNQGDPFAPGPTRDPVREPLPDTDPGATADAADDDTSTITADAATAAET